MDHGSRLHFPLSLSARYRWAACPGSYQRSRAVPELPPSEHAVRGTLAHAYLEALLRGYLGGWDGADVAEIQAHHEALIDPDEDAKAVDVCFEYVMSIMEAYPDATLYVERKLPIHTVNGNGLCGGTCDICIHVPSIRTLFVIDYKHGVGKVVEVEGNPQTLGYAHAALDALAPATVETVSLCIVQPRAFHAAGPVRTWTIPKAELDVDRDVLELEIELALDEKAPLIPGSDQCRWCPAALTCPAAEAKWMKPAVNNQFATVKTVRQDMLPDPETLPLDYLAYALQAKAMFDAWYKNVEELAYTYARQGKHIPGFKMVESSARRKWVDTVPPEELAEQMALLSGLDVDVFYPRKLANITDAEKAFIDAAKEGVPPGKRKKAAEDAKQTFAWFTTRVGSGTPTLVPFTDKRPEFTPTTTAFKSVTVIDIEDQ